eukprot:Gb_04508 [translate_table: standard]
MEGLSKSLNLLKSSIQINEIHVALGCPSLNHELFANDTTLMNKARIPEVKAFKSSLSSFSSVFRALISYEKSKIFIYGDCYNKEEILNLVGILEGENPFFKYLEVPNGPKRVLEKYISKLGS